MPRPHQAGSTRRHHRQIKLPLGDGDPSEVKQGRSATHPRRSRRTSSPVVTEFLQPPCKPCEVPVAGASKSMELEKLLNIASLEELIFDSLQIVPHKTIDSSSRSFTSRCQKLMAGVADSMVALPLLELDDVPSLDEFLDNSSKEKLVACDVSSLEELLNTTSSEESITVNPRTVPHNTIDGLLTTFPSKFGKLVTDADGSTSALTLQETDVSSLYEFCDSSSEESITTSPRMVPHNTIDSSLSSASSLGSCILIRQPLYYFDVFYVRIDRRGTFWIYPNLGGPFQSIDGAKKAINSRNVLQCEARTTTTKENTHGQKWYLVEAILDHFNDENNLSGNLAHELEDILRKQWILENLRWYYHFNFTTKQKTDGGHCFGCKNNGSPDMQHPDEADAYTGGHMDGYGYLPFGCDDLSSSDDNDGEVEDVIDDDDNDYDFDVGDDDDDDGDDDDNEEDGGD